MKQDINKLVEEADKNCQEMIRLLKECVDTLDRMENMIDKAIKKQMKELGRTHDR